MIRTLYIVGVQYNYVPVLGWKMKNTWIIFGWTLLATFTQAQGDIRSHSGELHFKINSQTTSMSLNTTGLGIGVTSPQAQLDVQGNAMIQKRLNVGSKIMGSANLNISGSFSLSPKVLQSGNSYTAGQESLLFVQSNTSMRIDLPTPHDHLGKTLHIKATSSQCNVLIHGGNVANTGLAIMSANTSKLPAIELLAGQQAWHILSQYGDVSTGVSASNLIAWYDANDVDGDGTPEGNLEANLDQGRVMTWVNKAGPQRHLYQSIVADAPSLSLNAKNGLSGLYFDPDDNKDTTYNDGDYMRSTDDLPLDDTITVFMVFKGTGGADYGYYICLGKGNDIGIQSAGKSWLRPAFNGSTSFKVAYSSTSQADVRLLTSQFNGHLSQAYFEGQFISSGNSGTAGTSKISKITVGRSGSSGSKSFKEITIYEILIYDDLLNDATRQSVERYLKTKWGM